MEMTHITLINITLNGISILLYSSGVFYLQKLQQSMTNQKVLLTSYSIAGILVAVSTIISLSICLDYGEDRCAGAKPYSTYSVVMEAIQYYFDFAYLLQLLILLADRVIGVTFPLQFQDILPKSRLLLMIILSWILSLFLAIPIGVSYSYPYWKYARVAILVLGGTMLILSITGYAWIGFKIHQSRSTTGQSRPTNQSKFLIVVMSIVL